jgi:hypothetical protein
MTTRQGMPCLSFFNTFKTHIPCGYLLGITGTKKEKRILNHAFTQGTTHPTPLGCYPPLIGFKLIDIMVLILTRAGQTTTYTGTFTFWSKAF